MTLPSGQVTTADRIAAAIAWCDHATAGRCTRDVALEAIRAILEHALQRRP